MSPVFMSLFTHMGWADQGVVQALRQAVQPARPALELFAHLLGSEHVWLARIEGRTPDVAVWPVLNVDQCDALARENLAGYRALLDRLTPADLARQVHYRNSAGLEFDTAVGDILLHVCLHGSYHRGQVARAIREAGGQPPSTDFIAWARGTPAATRQT